MKSSSPPPSPSSLLLWVSAAAAVAAGVGVGWTGACWVHAFVVPPLTSRTIRTATPSTGAFTSTALGYGRDDGGPERLAHVGMTNPNEGIHSFANRYGSPNGVASMLSSRNLIGGKEYLEKRYYNGNDDNNGAAPLPRQGQRQQQQQRTSSSSPDDGIQSFSNRYGSPNGVASMLSDRNRIGDSGREDRRDGPPVPSFRSILERHNLQKKSSNPYFDGNLADGAFSLSRNRGGTGVANFVANAVVSSAGRRREEREQPRQYRHEEGEGEEGEEYDDYGFGRFEDEDRRAVPLEEEPPAVRQPRRRGLEPDNDGIASAQNRYGSGSNNVGSVGGVGKFISARDEKVRQQQREREEREEREREYRFQQELEQREYDGRRYEDDGGSTTLPPRERPPLPQRRGSRPDFDDFAASTTSSFADSRNGSPNGVGSMLSERNLIGAKKRNGERSGGVRPPQQERDEYETRRNRGRPPPPPSSVPGRNKRLQLEVEVDNQGVNIGDVPYSFARQNNKRGGSTGVASFLANSEISSPRKRETHLKQQINDFYFEGDEFYSPSYEHNNPAAATTLRPPMQRAQNRPSPDDYYYENDEFYDDHQYDDRYDDDNNNRRGRGGEEEYGRRERQPPQQQRDDPFRYENDEFYREEDDRRYYDDDQGLDNGDGRADVVGRQEQSRYQQNMLFDKYTGTGSRYGSSGVAKYLANGDQRPPGQAAHRDDHDNMLFSSFTASANRYGSNGVAQMANTGGGVGSGPPNAPSGADARRKKNEQNMLFNSYISDDNRYGSNGVAKMATNGDQDERRRRERQQQEQQQRSPNGMFGGRPKEPDHMLFNSVLSNENRWGSDGVAKMATKGDKDRRQQNFITTDRNSVVQQHQPPPPQPDKKHMLFESLTGSDNRYGSSVARMLADRDPQKQQSYQNSFTYEGDGAGNRGQSANRVTSPTNNSNNRSSPSDSDSTAPRRATEGNMLFSSYTTSARRDGYGGVANILKSRENEGAAGGKSPRNDYRDTRNGHHAGGTNRDSLRRKVVDKIKTKILGKDDDRRNEYRNEGQQQQQQQQQRKERRPNTPNNMQDPEERRPRMPTMNRPEERRPNAPNMENRQGERRPQMPNTPNMAERRPNIPNIESDDSNTGSRFTGTASTASRYANEQRTQDRDVINNKGAQYLHGNNVQEKQPRVPPPPVSDASNRGVRGSDVAARVSAPTRSGGPTRTGDSTAARASTTSYAPAKTSPTRTGESTTTRPGSAGFASAKKAGKSPVKRGNWYEGTTSSWGRQPQTLENNCDFTITIVSHKSKTKKTYHMHKDHLLREDDLKCEYFDSLLRENSNRSARNKDSVQIQLEEEVAQKFPTLLDYLYNGELNEDMTIKDAVLLLVLADYFKCAELIHEIEQIFLKLDLMLMPEDCLPAILKFQDVPSMALLVSHVYHLLTESLLKDSSYINEVAGTLNFNLVYSVVRHCNDILDSHKLVEEVKDEKYAPLCNLVTRYITMNKKDLGKREVQHLTSSHVISVITPESALRLMELEADAIEADWGSLSQITSLQQRCMRAIARHGIENMDVEYAQGVFSRLNPSIYPELLALSHAKKENKKTPSLDNHCIQVTSSSLNCSGLYRKASIVVDGKILNGYKMTKMIDGTNVDFCIVRHLGLWKLIAAESNSKSKQFSTQFTCSYDNPDFPPSWGWYHHDYACNLLLTFREDGGSRDNELRS